MYATRSRACSPTYTFSGRSGVVKSASRRRGPAWCRVSHSPGRCTFRSGRGSAAGTARAASGTVITKYGVSPGSAVSSKDTVMLTTPSAPLTSLPPDSFLSISQRLSLQSTVAPGTGTIRPCAGWKVSTCTKIPRLTVAIRTTLPR